MSPSIRIKTIPPQKIIWLIFLVLCFSSCKQLGRQEPADPKQFMDFVEQGRIDEAKPLVSRLPNINFRNVDKGLNTPLHFVARWGTPEMLTSLLSSGADVNAKNAYGEPPLYWAITGGNFENVKILLKLNPNVEPDIKGWRPLHVAAKYGDVGILTYMLENGADLNAKTNNGESVADIARNCNQPKVTAYLKEKWLGPEWTDQRNWTPIQTTTQEEPKPIADWKNELGTIRSAISIYYGDTEGLYPKTLAEMVPRYLVKAPGPDFVYDPKTGNVIYSPYPDW